MSENRGRWLTELRRSSAASRIPSKKRHSKRKRASEKKRAIRDSQN